MALISTRDLSDLPDIPRLMRLLQSMAMLDAVLSPEWEYRYYSFNAHWDKDASMGSIRDGQGDELFALFGAHGAFLKGIAHDSRAAAAGIPSDLFYRDLPREFSACRHEPAFSPDAVTFCIWRLFGPTVWSCGKVDLPVADDADGSARMLSMLDGSPETYQKWARTYYECDVPLAAVAAVYNHAILTDDILLALNPRSNRQQLNQDIFEIGYPATTPQAGA
jgi:hypothetical protein